MIPLASTQPGSGSAQRLALACLLIGAGGVLLGLQRQDTGTLVGTGFTGLGMGVFVALVALVYEAAEGVREGHGVTMPRDRLAILAAASGFFGVAFLVSGVLVPGGPWMFVEVLVLLFVLARTSGRQSDGLRVGRGTAILLAVMLLFRLWVTWQGTNNNWAAMTIDVPILSGIPWLPDGVRTVQLGEFSADDFNIPRTGLIFSHTVVFWALGFALCAAGLWLRQRAAWEYENDRVQDTIDELPPELVRLVTRLLPEEEWPRLGLHHLSERQRKKRITALTQERAMKLLDFRKALEGAALGEIAARSDFAREVEDALEPLELPAPRESRDPS